MNYCNHRRWKTSWSLQHHKVRFQANQLSCAKSFLRRHFLVAKKSGPTWLVPWATRQNLELLWVDCAAKQGISHTQVFYKATTRWQFLKSSLLLYVYPSFLLKHARPIMKAFKQETHQVFRRTCVDSTYSCEARQCRTFFWWHFSGAANGRH